MKKYELNADKKKVNKFSANAKKKKKEKANAQKKWKVCVCMNERGMKWRDVGGGGGDGGEI